MVPLCGLPEGPGKRMSDTGLLAEFDGAEIGEAITVELCEMTEQELDDLPEFEGW